jgi:hypothetical protein
VLSQNDFWGFERLASDRSRPSAHDKRTIGIDPSPRRRYKASS